MFARNVVLAMIALGVFFSSVFSGRHYRKAFRSRKELRQAYLRKLANSQFALYALGGMVFVAGLAVALPWISAALSFNVPNVFRSQDDNYRTFVVIYNRWIMNGIEFFIYSFLSPIVVLVSLAGLKTVWKSKRTMNKIENSMKRWQ